MSSKVSHLIITRSIHPSHFFVTSRTRVHNILQPVYEQRDETAAEQEQGEDHDTETERR